MFSKVRKIQEYDAPAQKSSLGRRVSSGGEPPFPSLPGEGWLGQEAHPLQPGKEPACALVISCRKPRIAEGLSTYQETRKGTAKDAFSSVSGTFMKHQIPRQW